MKTCAGKDMIKRRKARKVRVGDLEMGGNDPILVQSMTKTDTSDVRATVSQIKMLERHGCEIIRVAVKDIEDAQAIKAIKRGINIPLVCDIHFDYRLALKAIENGADKIRLNPGNIKKREEVKSVVRAARKAGIPIRIGVNSGSVFGNRKTESKSYESHDETLSSALVNSALNYVRLFEDLDFRDIIISLKASDICSTVKAYRSIARLCDYPLHLGVTASGTLDFGIVKSAIGIGALLLDGIGDTIRVSLTADPVEEVAAARRILSSLGKRDFGPDIISCPTCGRCQVDLTKIVKDLERRLSGFNYQASGGRPIAIAVMGCEVNGPGEAREADAGIAFGKGSGMLFKKGKIVKRVGLKDAVRELIKTIPIQIRGC